jgi:uridine kinase
MQVTPAQPQLEVMLPSGKVTAVAAGRSLLDIAKEVQHLYPAPIAAALLDNKLRELTFFADRPGKLEFLDLTTTEGARIYHRSLTFLFIYAARLLFPEAQIKVEHSLGKALFCEISKEPELTSKEVTLLEWKMRELVRLDLPFVRKKLTLPEAMETFRLEGFDDKLTLYRYLKKELLTVYSLGEMHNCLHGYMLPGTGCLRVFALEYHHPGLVLHFPDENNPADVSPFNPQPKLFEIFRESEKWSRILGFGTVGIMNDLFTRGEGPDIVRIAEALHEKKIARIADMISERGRDICIILVAGPSSSGKTTFSQRLRTQLLVNGIRPFPVSLDDYFVDRKHTPLDEANNLDFEHLEAIDLELFNQHLLRLINGEEVEIPTFNFFTGAREYKGKKIKLAKDQPLIIEGIHGLNERLTQAVPRQRKFKIYVSALTSLNVDWHTRIHTTDTRLLRRIVRDSQFRGVDAQATIRRWPSVRRGEDRNIFNFQEEADIMFNSALVYEFAVLKELAEPLLQNIAAHEREYVDANRLLTFLSCFVPLDALEVPSNSILREFIGESCFYKV